MAPPRRVVSKASPVARKNPAAKAQPVTPSKRKASQSKKQDAEDRISIDSDSDDVKVVESKTPTKKDIQIRKSIKEELSDEETPTKKKARKSVKVEDSEEEVQIVASTVKNVNKKLKLDTAKKSTRVFPPSPGTLEYAKLEPITYSKELTDTYGLKRRPVDAKLSSEDETKSAKRLKVGKPSVVMTRRAKQFSFGTISEPAAVASSRSTKRKHEESSDDEEGVSRDPSIQASNAEHVDEESDVGDRKRKAEAKKTKSVFIDDEASEHDEDNSEVDEESATESVEAEVVYRKEKAKAKAGAPLSKTEKVVVKDLKGKGKAMEPVVAVVLDDPIVGDVFIDHKGKGKGKEFDNQEGAAVKPADDGELEDEDEIFVDEPIAALDKQGSGINDDGKPFVYHADLHKPRFVEDPNQIVMQDHLQDPLIKHTYANLPWVGTRELIAFMEDPMGRELVWFSTWKETIRPYQEEKILKWLMFQKSEHFVNLSRVDPNLLSVAKTGYSYNEFLVLPGQTHGYCVALSLIEVTGCNLINPKVNRDNVASRKVAGVLHRQEMQRLMGCAGLLFDFEKMGCGMYGWNLYFTVKKDMSASTPNSPVKSMASPAKPGSQLRPAVAVRRETPATEESKGEGSSTPLRKPRKPFKPVMDYSDKVPIYDGRNKKLDPNTQLDRLSELPLWKGGNEDAPAGSLAVVGYTMHTYQIKRERNMSLNVQWLLVLGTP